MELTKLKIDNFRSIKSATIDQLGRLSIIIGQNGAGKSTLFRGLEFVTRAINGEQPFFPEDRSAYATIPEIDIQAHFRLADKEIDHCISSIVQSEQIALLLKTDSSFQHVLVNSLRDISVKVRYNATSSRHTILLSPIDEPQWLSQFLKKHLSAMDSNALRRDLISLRPVFMKFIVEHIRFLGPIRAPVDFVPPAPVTDFTSDAANLLNAIYHHRAKDTNQYRIWKEAVNKLFPDVEEILTPPDQSKRGQMRDEHGIHHDIPELSLGIRERGIPIAVPKNSLSSGLQEALSILGRIEFADEGSIIVMEEPEIHFHEATLRKLIGVIEGASKVKQIFIVTHSGFFLVDDIRREPSDIIEITRDAGGTHTLKLQTEKDVENAYYRLQGKSFSANPVSDA